MRGKTRLHAWERRGKSKGCKGCPRTRAKNLETRENIKTHLNETEVARGRTENVSRSQVEKRFGWLGVQRGGRPKDWKRKSVREKKNRLRERTTQCKGSSAGRGPRGRNQEQKVIEAWGNRARAQKPHKKWEMNFGFGGRGGKGGRGPQTKLPRSKRQRKKEKSNVPLIEKKKIKRSQAVNKVLPFRAGDDLRTRWLRQPTGTPPPENENTSTNPG